MARDHATTSDFISTAVAGALAATPSFRSAPARLPQRSGPLDIVVPVHDNLACVRECLNSLLATLTDGDTVWLVDDASTDPAVPEALEGFSHSWPSTRLVTNPDNLGFVGTVNLAFAQTFGDVVILNSDTRVTPGWLEHLQAALENSPGAGIACPVSDNATLLSVVPAEMSAGDRHEATASRQTLGAVPLPTAVGFCMLIRRSLLDEIGGFCRAFSPGYGEECDFSMRALRAGWDVLACDQAVVFHSASGSFGKERAKALQIEHQKKLDRLWPEYAPLVQSWWRDNPLRPRIEQAHWAGDERVGVVHVLHREFRVGGTERITRDLIAELAATWRNTLLYPGETGGAWCDFEQRPAEEHRELMLNRRWIRPGMSIAGAGHDLSCGHSERALARVIQGSEAGIVHFHHMLHWDSLILPLVARALGCRTVISVHDLWFNCPIYNQMEAATGEPCGRDRAHPDTRCDRCLKQHREFAREPAMPGAQLREYLRFRHAVLKHVLESVDSILVPSQFIRDRLVRAYALQEPGKVRLMPQGVRPPVRLPEATGGDETVIAFFGGDQVLKGASIMLDMARALEDSPARFRVFGRIRGFDPDTLPPNVELHGFYSPQEIDRVMDGVDLALIPSFYEESFSMVLSECRAHGVPVLASTRGALGERIEHGRDGWLVSDMNPGSWVHALRQVLQGDTLARMRARLERSEVLTIDRQAREIDGLYRALLASPAPVKTDPGDGKLLRRFHQKVESLRADAPIRGKVRGTRCLGIVRDHWATAQYRVRIPLEDLARSGQCEGSDFHVVRASGFDFTAALGASGARRVAVQPFISDDGLKMMESLHRAGVLRLTLVIDDLWTDLPPDNPVRAMMPDDVSGRLKYAASLCESVVLTTEPLRQRLDIEHDNIHVIDNAIPERMWRDLPAPVRNAGEKIRIGWAGAPQHAGDLVFLEAVMRETRDVADWVFLGMCPEALEGLAAEIHPMVAFDRYPATLACLGLDIGIAPLVDHPFNRCKSHLKVLEYGMIGVPVVAARLDPYLDCPVVHAAVDDPADWAARLLDLARDKDQRTKRGLALRDWVLENHLTQHRRGAWLRAMGIPGHAD